jgi:hypothetical protein
MGRGKNNWEDPCAEYELFERKMGTFEENTA